ncbi:helix-turn-helix domain-containing protein [Citricoccus zhacaiensis]
MESFDSRRVPTVIQRSLWEKATAQFLVPLRIDASGVSITGIIVTRRLGAASLCRVRASPHRGIRTRDLAGGVGAGNYKIALALNGRVRVAQHGRQVLLEPGQLAVYDTSEEYSVGSEVPFDLLIALVPCGAVDLTRDRIAAVAATQLGGELAPSVRRGLLSLVSGQDAGSLEERTWEALRRLVLQSTPPRRPASRPDGRVAADARRLIGERLADPDLTPDYVAAVLGVSRRYLYNAFSAEVGPVAHYIRTLRLERARELLAVEAETPVAAVGLACGFTDPAHFSRLFRRAYGVSPLQYRTA